MKLHRTLACLAALALSTSGCAAMRAASARSQYIKAQTENLVIAHPIDQVWPSVQTLIFSRGYQLKQAAAVGAYSLETETKWESSSTGSTGTRYLVQGIPVDQNSCRVMFNAFTEHNSNNGMHSQDTARDWQMEFELLKRVDPQKAAEIDQGAEKQAEMARNQS